MGLLKLHLKKTITNCQSVNISSWIYPYAPLTLPQQLCIIASIRFNPQIPAAHPVIVWERTGALGNWPQHPQGHLGQFREENNSLNKHVKTICIGNAHRNKPQYCPAVLLIKLLRCWAGLSCWTLGRDCQGWGFENTTTNTLEGKWCFLLNNTLHIIYNNQLWLSTINISYILNTQEQSELLSYRLFETMEMVDTCKTLYLL